MRKAIVITETLIVAILSLLTAFVGGAVVNIETDGAVTNAVNYESNVTKPCVEKQYPEIIITDKDY